MTTIITINIWYKLWWSVQWWIYRVESLKELNNWVLYGKSLKYIYVDIYMF